MGLETATYVASLNSANPAGSDIATQGDDHIRLVKAALQASLPSLDHAVYLDRPSADVASAGTCNIGAATTNFVKITGTTAITSLGTVAAGVWRYVRFEGALTLTYDAVALILPGAASITTAANDRMLAISLGSGNWFIFFYQPASGNAIKVDISGLTADASPDIDADYLPEYDASATANKKVLLRTLFKLVNSLTEDASPDTAADFLLSYDTSASDVKKVKPSSIAPAAAAQADQETASSTSTYVSPGRQQSHPSAAKCWAYVTVSLGTPTLQSSFNITSIADTATGKLTITIATDFSSANWAHSCTGGRTSNSLNGDTQPIVLLALGGKAAGSILLWCNQTFTGDNVDPAEWSFAGFGDQ